MSQLTRSLVLACCIAWSTGAGAAATIQGVGDLPGGGYESWVNGVSADGGTVFGYGTGDDGVSLGDAFRWTEEFGIEALGWDQQGTSAVGASLYGQYIAVTSGTQLVEWFLWTEPLGLERITHGEAVGISDDASVVASNDTRGALRWTAATGAVVLDPFPSDMNTIAEGISGNGEFIVGVSYNGGDTSYRAVRWNSSGVPLVLGDLPGGDTYAWAYAISEDGSVVVGGSSTDEPGGAFRWTAAGGMQNLGVLPGGEAGGSGAHAVSPDGVVVLGQSFSTQGYQPVVWDAHHGMRGLAAVLANDHGLDVGALGWSLFNVTGISADRRTIVGTGQRNILEPPSVAIAYEGYVVRLDTPLPEPRAASLSGVACIALFALRRRRRRGGAIASIFLAATLVSGAASAQVEGTDCGCTLTGAYLSPDAGVRPDGGAVSPGGVFRVEGGALPGPITVVRQSNGAQMLQVQANDWGWSPDGERILILSVTGAPPNTSRQYFLYDLAGGPTTTPVWSSPASTLWNSERLRFSEDGAVLLFAALSQANNNQVELAAVEVATGATLTDAFSFFNPPSSFDDDSDPEVAGWGFGPDPTRLAYGYTTGQGNYTRVLGNVSTQTKRGLQYTANDEIPFFSPCGDVFAEKVRQLATSDDVTVTLYATADPQANPIANRGFANGVAVEVRANLADHVGLLGGTEHPIVSNVADDACPATNQPPNAAFTLPADPVAGEAAAFTDTSSDADGTIVAWSWEFGDGGSSSARHPSHVFASAGVYTVSLTVTDDDGAPSTTTRQVQVCEDLDAMSGALLYSIDAGLQGDPFNRDLFAYDPATGATAQITDSDWEHAWTVVDSIVQADGSGTWAGARRSPDGTQIVFASSAQGESGIWVMDTDGRSRRRLTDGGGTNGDFDLHGEPAWSPDGAWIVFSNNVLTDLTLGGLYMIRADGTGLVKIPGTSWDGNGRERSPDFFPSVDPSCVATAPSQRGTGCYRIAFVHDPYTAFFTDTIRSVRGDGISLQTIVAEQGVYTSVRVAPDGARLAVARELYLPPAGDRGIYIVDLPATPGSQRRVTDPGQHAIDPVWSPDGRFVAYQGETIGQVERDLFVTDGGGCAARALRADPAVEEAPEDWSVGAIAQAPVSLAGYVDVNGARVGGVTMAIAGDANATVVSAPDGSFRFENLPAGGSFVLSIAAVPDGLYFYPTAISIKLGGNVVNARVLVFPDEATIEGTVRFEGAPLEGMVIRAEGPGGPFEATTDFLGRYRLTTRRNQVYTITGSLGDEYRLEPRSRSVAVGELLSLDLVAVAGSALPPDRIAFTSTRDGNEEIYLLDLATGTETNLTNDAESDRDPAWSPDGARIAFTTTRDLGSLEIYLMDADGSNPTPAGIFGGFEPAWSPDGEWLAYATAGGIGLYQLATGASWYVTNDRNDRSPRWRTDGSLQIVFERSIDANGDVTTDLFAVDVSNPYAPVESPVVEQPGDDIDPAFSAASAGSRLAYATADGDVANEIGVRAETGGGSDRATPGRNPSWSPDGRFVIYDDAGSLRVFEPGSAIAPETVSATGTNSDPDWQPVSPSSQPACGDGLDDDGDGLVDMDDPGCPFPYASPENPPCDNGVDDDGNGLTDFDDPNCSPEWPYWENPPACGLGGELVFAYAAIAAALRRRRAPSR